MKLMKAIYIGAAVAMSVLSLAQFPGGGQRGGMRGMMGGGRPVMLLMRPDVREELKISDEQGAKMTEIQQSMMQNMQGMMAGGQRPDREAMSKMWGDVEKKTMEVLTPEQQKRLRELFIQRQKNQAVMDKDVQKELNLSADQLAKLKTLQEQSQKASGALMEKARAGEMDWQQMGEKMRANGEVMNTEIGKVLTEAQRKKLIEMGGKPFEFKEDGV